MKTGGLEGHVSRDCTMEPKPKSCYKCGQEGHIVRLLFVHALTSVAHCPPPFFSLVTAPKRLLRVQEEAGHPEEPRQALNATAVANQVILRVHVPSLEVIAVVDTAVEVEVEGTAQGTAVAADLEEEEERLGMQRTISTFLDKILINIIRMCYSYTCGGVGHLSRDCVQGSKCYNCSGVVSFLSLRSEII